MSRRQQQAPARRAQRPAAPAPRCHKQAPSAASGKTYSRPGSSRVPWGSAYGAGRGQAMVEHRGRVSDLPPEAGRFRCRAGPGKPAGGEGFAGLWRRVRERSAHAGLPDQRSRTRPEYYSSRTPGDEARKEAEEAREERQQLEVDVAKLAADANRPTTAIRVSAPVAIRAVRDDPQLLSKGSQMINPLRRVLAVIVVVCELRRGSRSR